jgi:hypothetical protein
VVRQKRRSCRLQGRTCSANQRTKSATRKGQDPSHPPFLPPPSLLVRHLKMLGTALPPLRTWRLSGLLARRPGYKRFCGLRLVCNAPPPLKMAGRFSGTRGLQRVRCRRLPVMQPIRDSPLIRHENLPSRAYCSTKVWRRN